MDESRDYTQDARESMKWMSRTGLSNYSCYIGPVKESLLTYLGLRDFAHCEREREDYDVGGVIGVKCNVDVRQGGMRVTAVLLYNMCEQCPSVYP